MLEEVLAHIHNWFDQARVSGTFTIADGVMDVDAAEGQYIRVIGSVFNDGLHCSPCRDLVDETFAGEVWLLAVPRAVTDLADEIGRWCEANAEALDSPFQSESFGGYSYSKASGGSADGPDGTTWQAHFRARLNPYRKLP